MATGPVVLDAMGGDHAPEATVAGALKAVAAGVEVVLVGQLQALEQALERAGAATAPPIVEAAQVVTMDDDPVAALRAKPEASIRVAAQLVADGHGAALVSAGSTGATLTAGLLALGRLPGVRRPVVAAVLPVADGGRAVLVDAGGSMDVHATVFPSYAAMGAAYAAVLGIGTPTVGLLNVGSEPGKGNELTKDAFETLQTVAAFRGNVEPPAVLRGVVDVVVTDGFTGNVFLKTLESVLHAAVAGGTQPPARDAAAILLGVRGEVLVAHGAADGDDVARALQRAAQVAEAGLSERVGQRLAQQEEQA